jgi:hypothetical protein
LILPVFVGFHRIAMAWVLAKKIARAQYAETSTQQQIDPPAPREAAASRTIRGFPELDRHNPSLWLG